MQAVVLASKQDQTFPRAGRESVLRDSGDDQGDAPAVLENVQGIRKVLKRVLQTLKRLGAYSILVGDITPRQAHSGWRVGLAIFFRSSAVGSYGRQHDALHSHPELSSPCRPSARVPSRFTVRGVVAASSAFVVMPSPVRRAKGAAYCRAQLRSGRRSCWQRF